MRELNLIVVHCSATVPEMDIGAKEIRQWHKDKGWRDIGYHYVIRRNGQVEDGRPLNEIGAHARGHNQKSVGICLVGGVGDGGKPDANFRYEQYKALKHLIRGLRMAYGPLTLVGHRELTNKACPSFNVEELFNGDSDSDN